MIQIEEKYLVELCNSFVEDLGKAFRDVSSNLETAIKKLIERSKSLSESTSQLGPNTFQPIPKDHSNGSPMADSSVSDGSETAPDGIVGALASETRPEASQGKPDVAKELIVTLPFLAKYQFGKHIFYSNVIQSDSGRYFMAMLTIDGTAVLDVNGNSIEMPVPEMTAMQQDMVLSNQDTILWHIYTKIDFSDFNKSVIGLLSKPHPHFCAIKCVEKIRPYLQKRISYFWEKQWAFCDNDVQEDIESLVAWAEFPN